MKETQTNSFIKHHFAFLLYLTIFTLLGYLAGRLTTKVEAIYNTPPVIELNYDINEKVPFIQIDRIINGILEGHLLEHDVRVVVGEVPVEIKPDRTFQSDVTSITNLIPIAIPPGMNFVSSKKGKKVYSVLSSQGEKIKPENRVYFRTLEEAIALGYEK
jgi:hypothetical protein